MLDYAFAARVDCASAQSKRILFVLRLSKHCLARFYFL
jgi:hypothetical protein